MSVVYTENRGSSNKSSSSWQQHSSRTKQAKEGQSKAETQTSMDVIESIGGMVSSMLDFPLAGYLGSLLPAGGSETGQQVSHHPCNM